MSLAAACQPNQQHYEKIPPPPPGVPAAPRYVPVAIDPALRAEARRELLAQSNASDPFLRCNAIEALAEVDPADAAGPILNGLKDPEPSVRFASAMAAGRIKLNEAQETLRAMANDNDLRVQAGVRYALHRMGDKRLSHDLERLAGVPDPHVRATVAMVLGLLGEPSAEKMLTTMASDRAPAVRIQVAEALWRLGDDAALDDLVAFSISAYPDDQIIAVQALAETGDQRVRGQVRGELTAEYEEVSLAAARAMGMLGSDEGWEVAVPAAQSKDPRQRSLAALAMGAIGRSDLQRNLSGLLHDPDGAVRVAAATAILQLRPPSETASGR